MWFLQGDARRPDRCCQQLLAVRRMRRDLERWPPPARTSLGTGTVVDDQEGMMITTHAATRSRVRAVRKRDRRNHFGRSELMIAVDRRFAVDQLILDSHGTARLLQLPADICRRLLGELVARGCLERTRAGMFRPRCC
jgi:hypothetical protein